MKQHHLESKNVAFLHIYLKYLYAFVLLYILQYKGQINRCKHTQ